MVQVPSFHWNTTHRFSFFPPWNHSSTTLRFRKLNTSYKSNYRSTNKYILCLRSKNYRFLCLPPFICAVLAVFRAAKSGQRIKKSWQKEKSMRWILARKLGYCHGSLVPSVSHLPAPPKMRDTGNEVGVMVEFLSCCFMLRGVVSFAALLLHINFQNLWTFPKYFRKLFFSLKTVEIGKCLWREKNASVSNAGS